MKNWTTEQKEEFTAEFYQKWAEAGFGKADLDSPLPWGCPWERGDEFLANLGLDVMPSLDLYWEGVSDEIRDNVRAAEAAEADGL